MKAIFKYRLPLGQHVISMPAYTLAKCGVDGEGALCVWLLHGDTEGPKTPHMFFAIGTGHQLPEQARIWLGSVTLGPFVWHIWTP